MVWGIKAAINGEFVANYAGAGCAVYCPWCHGEREWEVEGVNGLRVSLFPFLRQ